MIRKLTYGMQNNYFIIVNQITSSNLYFYQMQGIMIFMFYTKVNSLVTYKSLLNMQKKSF